MVIVAAVIASVAKKTRAPLALMSVSLGGMFVLCTAAIANTDEPENMTRAIVNAIIIGAAGIAAELARYFAVPPAPTTETEDGAERLLEQIEANDARLRSDIENALTQTGKAVADIAEQLAKNQKKLAANIRSALNGDEDEG